MEDKDDKKKQQDEPVEMTEDMLKQAIGDAVTSATSKMQERIDDLEKSQPKLIGDPEPAKERDVKSSTKKFAAKRCVADNVPTDEFSFVRFLNAKQSGKWHEAEYEQFALDETRSKALTWASGSGGGYWVGAEFLPQEFVDNYRAAQICRQAGCRVLPATGAPINIPKSTGSVTTNWVAQNGVISESTPTPGQIQLTPNLVAARSQLSKTLFQTSGGTAESIIRNDMAEALGAEIDNAILEGSGTSNQPTGMANTASINTVAASNADLTFGVLRNCEYELQKDDIKFKKPAWLMHPRTWHNIQNLEKDNKFVINPGQQDAARRILMGYPVYLSTQVSISNSSTDSDDDHANVFLADMDDVILAEWGGIDLDATDVGGDAWKDYSLEVRAVAAVDVGVRNPEAICLINDTTS